VKKIATEQEAIFSPGFRHKAKQIPSRNKAGETGGETAIFLFTT